MNELQVRLSADISALTSALNKAKATIKSFESETEKESEKGNVGFKRKIGLIEQLTNKAKALRTALSQATNEKQVEQYNQELERTSQELTRLNALGRSVTANLGSVGGGFSQVATKGANASGVAIEFNRVIQDAPFGLIGIGNNLQQLAGNFSQLSKTAGGTGKALAATFTSLVSPFNLGLLAISALTAGFTAYQMGAFDTLFANEEVEDSFDILQNSLDKTKESLNALNSARSRGNASAESEIAKVDLLIGVINDETLSRERRLSAFEKLQQLQPKFFGSITAEQALITGLKDEYNALTAAVFAKAAATAIEDKAGELATKKIDLIERERQETELQIQLLSKRAEIESNISKLQEITSKKASQSAGGFSQALVRNREELAKVNAELETLGIVSEVTNKAVNENAKSSELLKEAYKETALELGGLLDQPVSEGLSEVNSELQDTATRLGLISSLTTQIKDLNEQRNLAIDQEEVNLITKKISLLQQELDLINAKAKRANTPVDLGITATLPARDGNVGVTNPALEQGIIPDLGTDVFKEQAEEVLNTNQALFDSFSALSTSIVASFDIQSDSLKGFVTTLVSSAPKIISAIAKTAQANKAATESGVESSKKGALANGIFMSTELGKSLGPIGLALLPVLIGGAFALISSAFSKSGNGGAGGGGGGGGGGSASSGAPPQIFTNQQASVPNQVNPDLRGFTSGFVTNGGTLEARVDGDSLLFVLNQASEKRDRR